ncbi:hypothetical protein [Winogradskyella vidalii]|uniref:hypothetical protein n=1 Tax=Winogradskyella vidalii TaxID=2615024 RepID=UPI0015C8BC47|nr:hypothetical protein [Winogradskyella vidalii]
MKKMFMLFLLIGTLFSCSSDDSESETTTTTGGTTTGGTTATVNLTVINSSNDAQSGYIVMIFNEEVQENQPLPEILFQETSNSEGKVSFDLEDYVMQNGSGPYYFEAFLTVSNGFSLESITHPSLTVESGQVRTTSILVN